MILSSSAVIYLVLMFARIQQCEFNRETSSVVDVIEVFLLTSSGTRTERMVAISGKRVA